MYFGEPLDKWIDLIITQLSPMYGMKKKLSLGDFGTDALGHILEAILKKINPNDVISALRGNFDKESLLKDAHTEWCRCYIRWKQIYCHELSDNVKKSINTNDRNNRATSAINNLAETDIEMYIDIINIVFEILTEKILEAGIQNITLN
jgi:hypothetical protein